MASLPKRDAERLTRLSMSLLAVEIVVGLLGFAAYQGGLLGGAAILHAIWLFVGVSLVVAIVYSAVLRARRDG